MGRASHIKKSGGVRERGCNHKDLIMKACKAMIVHEFS